MCTSVDTLARRYMAGRELAGCRVWPAAHHLSCATCVLAVHTASVWRYSPVSLSSVEVHCAGCMTGCWFPRAPFALPAAHIDHCEDLNGLAWGNWAILTGYGGH